MSSKKLLCTGGAGSIVGAICCFTPFLVILLPALGFAAWLAWIDLVLFPALALFLGVTAYGAVKFKRERRAACETSCERPAQRADEQSS